MVSSQLRVCLLFCGVQIIIVLGLVSYYIGGLEKNGVTNDCKKTSHYDSLFDIGMKYATDKVYTHHYETLYEKYFTPYRHSSVRLLEIGLGCVMPRGIGASAETWREYLGSQADIHFLEFNETCGKAWHNIVGKKLNITMHYGSQEDILLLHGLVSRLESVDIIIDDGGHTMNQQKTSMIMLLPLVRSGGIYVIEDLETSYMPNYGGAYSNSLTTVSLIKNFVDEIQSGAPYKHILVAKHVSSFEIGDGICFFTVK